jgi:DNA-binding GntR family transcriptional regulator
MAAYAAPKLTEETPSLAVAPRDVTDAIRRMIYAGELRDGEAIRQEELAAELGVSRLPIREALCELAAEGLINRKPHRSATVVSLDQNDLAERIDLRLWIEPKLIKLAIENSVPAEIDVIAAILDEYHGLSRADWWRWAEINCRFHIAMYMPARRPLSVNLAERLMKETGRYRANMLRKSGSAHDEHTQLLEQFRKRNPVQGASLLRQHILRWRPLCLKAPG